LKKEKEKKKKERLRTEGGSITQDVGSPQPLRGSINKGGHDFLIPTGIGFYGYLPIM
jgi:hypothetical protein